MMSTINDTRGGHCNGTENNGYLKIEIHVCGDAGNSNVPNIIMHVQFTLDYIFLVWGGGTRSRSKG